MIANIGRNLRLPRGFMKDAAGQHGLMNDAAGHHDFVRASAAQLVIHFTKNSPEVRTAIVAATGAKTDSDIEQRRAELLAGFAEVRDKAAKEVPQAYVHYASRFDIVGVYQSVLSRVFSDIPAFQGYGNHNPVWVTTLLEQGAFKLESFFHEVHVLQGTKKSLLQAVIEAWREIKFVKAPYPSGLPTTLPLDETCTIALLADWGGDNPAAKLVADVVRRARPKIAVHLGDIYYGGVKEECEAFLRNWPFRVDLAHSGNSVARLRQILR